MAKESQQRNSFDELVAGISADERKFLLEKLRHSGTGVSMQTFTAPDDDDEDIRTLQTRLQSESLLYRFILWLRSFFSKQPSEDIYNEDLIANLARKVNRVHPGLIDYSHDLLQSLFYEKLKQLKECSDFFKPYITVMNDDAGEFYVFLSTFIAPEITESVDSEADPYSIPFDRQLTGELRASLLRKLDAATHDLQPESKRSMYAAVRSLEWLRQFTSLPYLHFLAQFTAIISDSYTCPFSNAQADYPAFARVLSNGVPVSNEALEALFLFPQRKQMKVLDLDSDNEKALREFLAKSASMFSMMQMFISTVPVNAVGRIIFDDCSWVPDDFGGGEDWGVKFRDHWKRVFDERWESWLRDRKKQQLSVVLNTDFGLKEFPDLPNRPWADLWGGVPFRCEMTAGFLAWFNANKFSEVMPVLNTLMLEGVFLNNENRTEFSEAVNEFSAVNDKIENFVDSLSPRGSVGSAFDQISAEHIRSLKGQARVDSLILNAETGIHEIDVSFCKTCRTLERVFHGILDDEKDTSYDSLQNLMTIRGHENREFREKMASVRDVLRNAQQLLAEIEPLDLPRQAASDTVSSVPVK